MHFAIVFARRNFSFPGDKFAGPLHCLTTLAGHDRVYQLNIAHAGYVSAQVLPGGLALGLSIADPRLRPIPAKETGHGAVLPPGTVSLLHNAHALTVLDGKFTNSQRKRNRVQGLQIRVLKAKTNPQEGVHEVSM